MKKQSNASGTVLILILIIIYILDFNGFIFKIDNNNRSNFELHHIYPQQHFGNIGDRYTVKIHSFEHIWVHSSGGFDKDWIDKRSYIAKIFFPLSKQLHEGTNIKTAAKRSAAIICGSRFISYQWVIYDYSTREITKPNLLFATTFDGVSNLLYNFSYIMSIPAKAVHFTIECVKRGFDSEYGLLAGLKMFVWMVFQLTFGLASAMFMICVGTIVGCIAHPLETLANVTISLSNPFATNLIASIISFITAIIKPIINIFFWKV